ncbi:TonB-dependent receptor, partial [Klebsiella pneumoniae]|nr:TonB-dependent receptor [Klebsiella pneumoniae]
INTGARRLIPDSDVGSISATGIFNFRKDKVGIEAGIRYDLYKLKTVEFGVKDSINYYPPLDLKYNSVNGSAGIVYKLTKNFTFKTNVS